MQRVTLLLSLFHPLHLQAQGPCNLGMPNSPSVYDRFTWYLRLLAYNGFVVVIDNHLIDDPTITVDPNLWLKVNLNPGLFPHVNHIELHCNGLSSTHSQATRYLIELSGSFPSFNYPSSYSETM